MQKYTDGDFLEVFRGILHPFSAQMQDEDGNYSVRISHIDDEHLLRHLTGEITLAFDVCTKPKSGKAKARFIGFDIDQNFQQRLPIYAATLRDLGIEKAALVTGGSSDSKGKIIICFREMVPKGVARSLALSIQREACERALGALPDRDVKGDLEIFPINADNTKYGGVLRVLGRQNKRNPDGAIEIPLGLDGCSLDVLSLKPLSYGRVAALANRLGFAEDYDDFPPAIRNLIREPWAYIGHDLTIRKIMRLAHFFAMKYDGGPEGEIRYRNALDEIRKNSPALPGPKNPSSSGNTRNPVETEIAALSAWQKAVERRWKPQALKPKTPGKGAYDAMVLYVKTNGLVPHAFAITERTLSTRMGVYANAARKQVKNAERHGLLLKLHRGSSKTLALTERGTRKIVSGTPAMYALIGFNEKPADVWAKACADKAFQARLRAAPIGPWTTPSDVPIIPTPPFWDLLKQVSDIVEGAEALSFAA